jgi:hypothetical protein
VRKHGVVLVSGKGPVPRLVDVLAGETVRGSWWGHPRSRRIFNALQAVVESDDVLVCRLVQGKVTLVHRRLWPALVRAAAHFPARQVAKVRQEHSASGHHANIEVPFPDWVPKAVSARAKRLGEAEALGALGSWIKP